MATARGDASPAGQLAFNLPHVEASGRDDFLVSEANRAALAAIDRWPDWPNPVLVLTGPAGCGKSHLAEIWRRDSGGHRIGIHQLTVERVPSLLERNALVVEDAPGPDLDERAMFHLINLARETRSHILLTSRIDPSRWGVRLPDLASRLKAAYVAPIGGPDDDLLRGVLIKLFADRQLPVDEFAIGFILERMHRSLGEAREIVAEIDSRSLAEKSEVTRNLIARVLARRERPEEAEHDE
jgi:chromosomal replication initiation ATPase DnaA